MPDIDPYQSLSNSGSAAIGDRSLGDGPEFVQEELHLKDAVAVFKRHMWLFVFVALTVFLFVVLRTFSRTPVYEASATLQIEQGQANIVGTGGELSRGGDSRRFYDTHYLMLQRRSLAEAALENLELIERFVKRAENAEPGFGEKMTGALRSMLGTSSIEDAEATPEEIGRKKAIDWLTNSISIRPEPNSELVNVVFVSTDQRLAADVANEMARQYVAENIRTRSADYQYAAEFLERELRASQERLERYEQEMREYSGGRDDLAITQRQEIAQRRLGDLGQSLQLAEQELVRLKTELDRAKESPETAEKIVQSGSVNTVRTALDTVQLEYEQRELYLEEGNRELQILRQREESLKKRLDAAIDNVLALMTANYNLALENYKVVKAAYDVQSKAVTEMEGTLLQYNIMAAQTESERETYQRLLDRSKEISIQKGLAINNIRIAEAAVVPTSSTYPRIGRNLALGIVAALIMGLGTIFFIEYMDRSIKLPEEFEAQTGLSCLAAIPGISAKDARGMKGSDPQPALITERQPNSQTAETFRYLRTAIIFSTPSQIPQVLIFSSCLPSEGKTTISINTATAFAQRGARVLVIDGDLKRPACHKVFGIDRRLGLTAFLTAQATLDDVIFSTEVEGMDFMPAGPLTPNPADLLDSEPMRALLEALRTRYDQIVIDSAPLAGMADSYILASMGDGVVIVTQAGRTPSDLIRRIARRLQSTGARLIGGVLNARKSRLSRQRTTVGGDYAGAYGYGDGYKYGYRAGPPEVQQMRPSRSGVFAATSSAGSGTHQAVNKPDDTDPMQKSAQNPPQDPPQSPPQARSA